MITQLNKIYSDVIQKWRISSNLSIEERERAIHNLNQSHSFSLFNEKLRSDKEIGFYAIHQFSWNILYLSPALQLDYDLLETALLKEPNILNQLSPYIKKDKNFAKQLLLKELSLTQTFNPFLSASHEQINFYTQLHKEPVSLGSFQFFDRVVRKDTELAKIALKIDLLNYHHISNHLKEDLEFSLYAINFNPDLYLFFNKKMKENQTICDHVLSLKGDFLNDIPNHLLHSKNIISAIKINVKNVFMIPKNFYYNKEICLAAVSINGVFLQELPFEMKNDFDIASSALFNTIYALPFIGKQFDYLIEEYRYNNQIESMEVSQWNDFPNFFYSKIKEKEMLEKLAQKNKFNFDNPLLNQVLDNYENDTDRDGSGSKGRKKI